jgi:hypothetical protein
MEENKSEIKMSLQEIYCIYCVLNTDLVSDYSSFKREKLTASQLRSFTIAANRFVL